MAMADYYEGQPVGRCPDCGQPLVRVKVGVTPEGEPVWDVSHAVETATVPHPQRTAVA